MKILIGVKSCQKDLREGAHQAIRETWGKDLPVDTDLRFFVGGEQPPENIQNDEIYLPVDDTYWVLWPKTKGALKYQLDYGYDFSFICDTDTYIMPHLWRTCGFEAYDFSGRAAPLNKEMGVPYPAVKFDTGEVADPFYVYMSGGIGYFVSRKAAQIIVNDNSPRRSEDVAMGQILGSCIGRKELTASHLPELEAKGSFHLGCGWYGGGNKSERLSPAAAQRRKHGEMK